MKKINPGNFLNEKRIPERPVSLKMSLHLNEDNTHLSVKIGIHKRHFCQNLESVLNRRNKLDRQLWNWMSRRNLLLQLFIARRNWCKLDRKNTAEDSQFDGF